MRLRSHPAQAVALLANAVTMTDNIEIKIKGKVFILGLGNMNDMISDKSAITKKKIIKDCYTSSMEDRRAVFRFETGQGHNAGWQTLRTNRKIIRWHSTRKLKKDLLYLG